MKSKASPLSLAGIIAVGTASVAVPVALDDLEITPTHRDRGTISRDRPAEEEHVGEHPS